jgi:hypothetical protein
MPNIALCCPAYLSQVLTAYSVANLTARNLKSFLYQWERNSRRSDLEKGVQSSGPAFTTALIMEAVNISESLSVSARLHGAIYQKITFFPENEGLSRGITDKR